MTNNIPLSQAISLEIEQALYQAITQHQSGQLQIAEELYLAILQLSPNHPDANHNMGVMKLQKNQPDAALPYFLTALEADQTRGQYWISYIDALYQAGQMENAAQVLTLAKQQGLAEEDVNALAQRLQIAISPAIKTADTPAASQPKSKSDIKRTTNKSAPKHKKTPDVTAVNRLSTLFSQGRYEEVIALAQTMTAQFPAYPYCWKALGAAYRQTGRNEEAIAPMQSAIALAPLDTESQNNLANTLQNMGRLAEAASCYRHVISINPKDAEAHCNLGVTLRQLGELSEAEASYRQAIQINPSFAEAYNNLGNTLKELDRWSEAEACYRQALQLKADYAAAYNNLGTILKEYRQFEEAVDCFHRALKINGRYAEAYSNLGDTLRELGRFDEALANCRQAIELKANYAEAHSNLSGVLKELGQLDTSLHHAQLAIEINPNLAVTHNNLGNVLQNLGNPLDAINSYRNSLKLNKNYTLARYNLGYSQLSCGQMTEGWQNHEFRTIVDGDRYAHLPVWSGEELTGKSILIWGEQGIGDEIMFASMYAEIIAKSGLCIIECAPKLAPLFTRSFPGARVIAKSIPGPLNNQTNIDFQSAAGSLARWLRPALTSFSLKNNWLKPDPLRVSYWKHRLEQLGTDPKVGFCWRSSLTTGERSLHYTQLTQWGEILTTPGLHFINLQYDQCSAELNQAQQQFGVPLHAFTEIDMYNDLDETAALISALDLVISAPTSVYTIAAALGVNTWVMTSGTPWLTHGTDYCPWYPTLRLFTRKWDQNWEEVLSRLSGQLHEFPVSS
jgi:tetratricopeptide (TPR) repeat protein